MSTDDDPSGRRSDPGAPDPAPDREGREDPVFSEALGRAIKVIRTGLDLGRRELAARAGLSYSYVAEIENGTKQASATAQQALAKALGLSVSELLAAAEEWAVRLRGEVEPEVSAFRDADWTEATAPRAESAAPLGARARQLRWFRDSATTRVWDRAERGRVSESRIAASPDAQPEVPTPRAPRSAAPPDSAHLARTLARLRMLLGRMSYEDRERVLDLAERLGND